VDIVLLHINDTHGNLSATPDSIKQKENIGSMPRLAKVLRELQQENIGHVLTLHAGDLFSRGEPVTIQTGGGIMIDILEKLNVDAFVPGNGEYYFGIQNLMKQTERVSDKILTANIKLRETGELFCKPNKVIKIKGIRIGIVGLGYFNPLHPSAKNLLFENPVKTGNEQAKALRDNVDLLVALTHIGHRWDIQLAKQVPEFDIIIGGHSHTVLRQPVLVPREQEGGNVVILQAGDYWRFVGKAMVRMEKKNDHFIPKSVTAELLDIDEADEPDPEMAAFLENARKPFEEIIAQVSYEYDKKSIFQLIHNAVTDSVPADIVIMDNGIVQAELAKGPVTLGDIYRIHPWRNEILKVSIMGKELESILPKVVESKKVVITGITADHMMDDKHFFINGEKINPDREYVIAVNDFAISQCTALTSLAFVNTAQRIDDVLLNYLREKNPVEESNPLK